MQTTMRNLSLSLIMFLATLPLSAQAPPCRAGTITAIIGTSCSVGPMTFNFQNDFQSGLTPTSAIGFQPVLIGDQAGFKLILNFNDGPSNPGSTGHGVQFSYTPQASPGTEIRKQSVSMDAQASVTGTDTAIAQILDSQFYPNSGFLSTGTSIDVEQGVTLTNFLSNDVFLEVPGFSSIASGFGVPTTQLFDAVTGTSSISFASATFLYTTGAIVPIPSLAPLTYKNIDLPGVASTHVSAILNSGRTVGSYQDSLKVFHGYVAEADGQFVTIDVPGARRTVCVSLNERGDVVGTYQDVKRRSHGFLQRDGVITTIDFPNSLFTSMGGINNKGQIVGEYESADLSFHGFLLDDGVFTTIDHGPGGIGASSGAFTINDQGEIAGFFFDPNTFRAYTQKQGIVQTIDVSGQGDTLIENVNSQGDAIGTFNDINLSAHGFLLSRGRFLTVDFPNATSNFAVGINGSGKIVGQYRGIDGVSHSYLATPVSDDGLDHRPNQPPALAAGALPDCTNADWHLDRAERLAAGPCQVKH